MDAGHECFRTDAVIRFYGSLNQTADYHTVVGCRERNIKMKLGKFLSIMTPTRPFVIECDGASATFQSKEEIPDMILDAELKKNRKDAATGQLIFEVKDEDGM